MKFRSCETNDDCIRACVASFIDRDDVPHVFNKNSNPEISWKLLKEYLKSHKKYIALIPSDEDPREFMQINNPETPYLLFFSNVSGDHCAIFRGSKKIHDPSLLNYQVKGPNSKAGWIIGLIGDLV
ncbi:MAG: hypothetical protein CMC15_18710 [Flavobacteriaceae bacterium]|mgnify:CR=1 FL=1|nr:hypothetical protein [Flavobacteriaceae bacterium]